MWQTLSPVVISTVVVGAIVAAIANVFIAIINNRRLKNLEKYKKISEMQKYRYTSLYELVKNWHNYDSPFCGESSGEIAVSQLVNRPLDDIVRYEIAKPLINPKFLLGLVEQAKALNEFLILVVSEDEHNRIALEKYSKLGSNFAESLKKAIHNQLQELLLKDDEAN